VIFVTIIIPYFKKKFFLVNCINSILNQSYKNFEIIIINDELTAESFELLSNVSKLDNRIKILNNESNIGAGESRNFGIKFAKGEYVAFCDSDDLWNYKKLEIQLKFMRDNDFDFSFTSYEIINEKDKKIAIRKAEKYLSFNKLKKSCDIGLSTVMIKRKIFDNKTFRFAKIKTKEDYVLWLKLVKSGIQLNGLDINLASWRKCRASLSSSTYQKLKDGFKVYNYYLGYNKIHSLFCLLLLSINFILKQIR
jgi:teichuronic acid biosynthesis glycosyltransferase TuaG